MQQRFFWLDWAKVIGIFLVVIGHIPTEYAYKTYIYAFHMPLFFIISGFLYKKISFKDEIIKCFRSLLLPYLLYGVLLLGFVTIGKGFDVSLWLNFFLGNAVALIGKYAPLCPLWFLITLILLRLASSVLNEKFFKISFILVLVLNVILGILFELSSLKNDYFMVIASLFCYPFWGIGVYLKESNISLKVQKNVSSTIIAVCLIITGGGIAFINGKIDLIRLSFGNNIGLFYIAALCLSVGMLFFCKMLLNVNFNVIQDVSRGTILILGLHYVMIKPLTSLISLDSWTPFVVAPVIMIVCFVLIKISQKYCPLFLGFKKK